MLQSGYNPASGDRLVNATSMLDLVCYKVYHAAYSGNRKRCGCIRGKRGS